MKQSELFVEVLNILEEGAIEDAHEEARILFEDLLGIERSRIGILDDEVPQDAARRVIDAANERLSGRPIQYITGRTYFMGFSFVCREGTLIPRQDTEHLCEQALTAVEQMKNPSVLDLCAGSGCVGLSIAKMIEHARVTLFEKYDGPLSLMKENADRLGLSDKVHIVKGDVFDMDTGELDGPFDVVVSNPPYVKTGDIDGLMDEVRNYEPRAALDGGADGYDFFRQIVKISKYLLAPGGRLLFEVGAGQSDKVVRLLEKGGFGEISSFKDYGGWARVVSGRLDT